MFNSPFPRPRTERELSALGTPFLYNLSISRYKIYVEKYLKMQNPGFKIISIEYPENPKTGNCGTKKQRGKISSGEP